MTSSVITSYLGATGLQGIQGIQGDIGIQGVQGDSSDMVSVAGKTGAVTLVASDVGLSNVTNVAQLASSQTLAITGDVTAISTGLNTGTIATELAAVGTAGTYNNSATETQSFTTDAKGRVTSTGTLKTITPAFSSITAKPTTLAGYGITDALLNKGTANTSLTLFNGEIGSATFVTSTATAYQVIDSNSSTVYRSATYQIQLTSGSEYQSCIVTLIHDGTTVSVVEYANISTGAVLATFDADISTGSLRLLTTPTNSVTTYKVIKTLVNI